VGRRQRLGAPGAGTAAPYSAAARTFQFGDDILVADLKTRRIGRITRGRGPAVILDLPVSPPD
jgi:hypothetical protein